jgi:hypothetical protein
MMKRTRITIAALALLLSGVAGAAPPPLLAESATLDRSYIPALMLSNGKDPAKARATQGAYEQAWAEFAARQRKEYAGDSSWTLTLEAIDKANADARAAVNAGRMADAHNAQEEVRHALWHQRRSMGLEYQPDMLTDFHATMELIIAGAQAREPAAIGDSDIAALRKQLAQARIQWDAVKSARWDPAEYGVDGPRLDAYRAALADEDRALDALAAALDTGEGARIAKAAPAIKPPFARAYASFGVFPR